MKRKFMQWRLTILSISTKQSPLILTHWTHKKDHEYNVGSPDPGLRQAQKCGRVKTVSNYCLFLTKGLYLPWHTKQYSDEMVVGELGCGGSLNKTVYWKSEIKSITSMCQHHQRSLEIMSTNDNYLHTSVDWQLSLIFLLEK
jgi:hypothetical protein